jgi:hypothetical protein
MFTLAGKGSSAASSVFEIVGAEDFVAETTTTTHSMPIPSGARVGDMLISALTMAGTPGTNTPPSGYSSAGGTNYIRVRYKIASSDDITSGLVVWGSENAVRSAGIVYAIRKSDTSLSFADAANVIDPPEVTASWGADENLFIAFVGFRNGYSATGYPSGYEGGRFAKTSGTSTAHATTAAAHLFSSSAASDPSAFTFDGTGNFPATVTLVVRST